MSKEVIKNDIANWLRRQLYQAVKDTSVRLEVMGLANAEGATVIMAEVANFAIGMFGKTSDISPEIVAEIIRDGVKEYRQEQKLERGK